jgi:hypothetical protein
MNELENRIDLLIEEVRQEPNGEKRLLSKTFWSQLKIERRTIQSVSLVRERLIKGGIKISTEYNEFGVEPKKEWIKLRHWNIPYPNDAWFTQMSKKNYDNEQEVDVFFLTPFFTALGYEEEDFHFEYQVDLSLKTTRKRDRKERVDLVLFDGTDRTLSNILVVCEAKPPDKPNSRAKIKNIEKAENDLKLYCTELKAALRHVATNGDLIKVYKRCLGGITPFVEIHRSEFKERWSILYLNLSKPVLVSDK